MRALLFLALQVIAAVALAQPVGRIDFAAGVSRIERGTQTILALRGTEVFEGDVITTGPDTQLQIRMADDAFLALRPNSRLALEKYKFNKGAEDGALLSLTHGILRAFTGAIAGRDREKFLMKTPLATVGIRGSGNILAHLGEDGTVNHTITGAHSVSARDSTGQLVTLVTRPGQTVQVRPGAAPRYVPTPSFIFAAASSAPPAQIAATSSSTTSGGGGTGGGGASESSSSAPATERSASSSSTSDSTSSSTTSTSSSSSSTAPDATVRASSTGSPGGSATTTTGSSTSPSSNVSTATAPANVRTTTPSGGGGGGGVAGASLAIVSQTTLPSGRHAALFATDADPGYSVIGRNNSGFVTSATQLFYRSMPGAYHDDNDLSGASLQITGGTEAEYFANLEQNIKMGRLQGGSITVTGEDCSCGSTLTRTDASAPGGLVFVVYDEAPRGVILSYTGTTTFRLDGGTHPIDARGNVGTLNTATMNANFTDRVLDFAFNLSVNNLTYAAHANGVSFDGVRFFAHSGGSPDLLVGCSGAGCSSAYGGAVNGSFAITGTNAWLAYHLFPTDNSDLVNGAIAFVANTLPTPRFTLPATGTWNMVLIDNYIGTGPGFPTFTTAANAQINFTTRRADFSFTFDRVLTPADVSAGYQAQRVTANAANLPLQGVGFVAETANGNRPGNLSVSCTGCSPTANPQGRFEGYLSYVAPNPNEGGNVNIYWYLTNNTTGTLGYDYNGSSYFGNAPTPRMATPVAPPALAPTPLRQLATLPDVVRGPLRPPR
jgi:hypothetical protein